MNKKRHSMVRYMSGLLVLVWLMSGCSQTGGAATPTTLPPTAPPEPTATAVPTATSAPTASPEPEAWDYVAIGDSTIALPGDYSYPGHYAAYIERDLRVAVTLHTFTKPEDVTEQILDLVRTNERWRDALSETEIVTLATGHMDIQSVIFNDIMNGECGGEDGLDCVRAELADLESDYNAIYAELFALCSPGTLIRTETYPYASLRGLGYDGDVRPFVEPLNELIIRVAAAHNVPVARVDLAFNGPDGSEDPATKGYMTDWLQTTKLGAEQIAGFLRDLGYEPTVP